MLTTNSYSVTPTGVLHNRSAPPRTSFDSRVSAVSGSFFVFQLTQPAKPLTKRNLARPIFDCGLDNIPPREQVEAAVRKVLAQGYRTADITEPGCRQVGTVAMGDAVLAAL